MRGRFSISVFFLANLAYVLAAQSATLKLMWLPNSESDLAGYRVYYGIAPQNYPWVLDAGLSTDVLMQGLLPGTEYFFAVSAYDRAGNESPLSPEISARTAGTAPDGAFDAQNGRFPTVFLLYQNYPNPASLSKANGIVLTNFLFDLPANDTVSLRIFDALGRQVRVLYAGALGTGRHHFSWDGRNQDGRTVPPGSYYYQLRGNSIQLMRKTMILR